MNALRHAVRIPSTYSATPAGQIRPPRPRQAINARETSTPNPARKLSVAESRQAKAAANRIVDRSSQWPPPLRAHLRRLANRIVKVITSAPVHNRTFNPQGVARKSPSPSTPSNSAASNVLIARFVFSLILSLHLLKLIFLPSTTQDESWSSCARSCSRVL